MSSADKSSVADNKAASAAKEVYSSGVVRGGLKLKGSASGSANPSSAGKKKSGSQSTSSVSVNAAQAIATNAANTTNTRPIVAKTTAEIAFEETMRKRQEARVNKIAAKSHKQKVEEYNAYLDKLSEHYDIPRVGPG